MAVANNADDYAASRVGIYFPGVTPYYDGQCVSLVKWFIGEMCGVSNWNDARGNAKDMGHTLVAQGLAFEVPYAERRRGDVVALEYGQYGHIYVQLSGGRVFEENVNMPGTSRKWVVDDWVYTSRIASDQEAWRVAAGKNPHVYRLRGYSEAGAGGDGQMIIQNADNWYYRCNKTHVEIRGRELGRDAFVGFVGQDFLHFVEACSDDPEADRVQNWQVVGQLAVKDDWQGQIYSLLDQLKTRPTAAQLKALQDQAQTLAGQIDTANKRAEAAEKKSAAMEVEHIEAQKAGNAFTIWIGGILSKLNGGK